MNIFSIVNSAGLFTKNMYSSALSRYNNCIVVEHNNFTDSGYLNAAWGRIQCAKDSLAHYNDPLVVSIYIVLAVLGMDFSKANNPSSVTTDGETAPSEETPPHTNDGELAGDVDAFEYANDNQAF